MTSNPFNELFDKPQTPVLTELQHLNEGKDDAFVNVMRDDGKHDNLIPVIQVPTRIINDPDSFLPGFAEWWTNELTDDTYATINSFFWRDNAYSEAAEDYQLIDANGKPLHKPIKGQKKQGNLRYLNAVYCDLDVYNAGIDQGTAIGRIITMMDERRIPPVSWIKNSGAGLWVFWALKPTRFWNKTEHDSFPMYRRIMRQIKLVFQELGADKRAIDGSRVSRIHGSRSHKTGSIVSLWTRTDETGQVARYTLDELEVFFGTYPRRHRFKELYSVTPDDPEMPEAFEEQIDPTRHARGIIGQTARWQLDLDRFWTLAEVVRQKRIKKGTRNTHVWILAAILKHVFTYQKLKPKQRAEAIQAAASRLWEAFEDRESYDLETVQEQLTSTLETQQRHTSQEQHMIKIKHQEISDSLQITTDEAAQLRDLVHGSRKDRFWPPATGQKPVGLKKKTKEQQADERRNYLARFHTRDKRPPLRQLAAMIETATGLPCTAPTAAKDWETVFPKDRRPYRPSIEFVQTTMDWEETDGIE